MVFRLNSRSMAGTRLVTRFFWVIMMIVTVIFVTVYFYSVPLVQNEVYAIEKNAARMALNNVFQLANKMYSNVEGYRQQAVDSHRERLRNVVDMAESHIRVSLNDAHRRGLSDNQALPGILRDLQYFRYGSDGYLWVADSATTLLSHPDPQFNGHALKDVPDSERGLILQNMVAEAINAGDGFYQYKWQRLDEGEPIDKLSYLKYFPEWHFLIGTGLYLDDLESEIQQRKKTAVATMREAMNDIRVAKSGYIFIFDKSGHMIAHPNSNIDRTNALALVDPASGRPILEELIEVADTDKELHYLWDRPNDPGNYVYEKISVVRSLEGFDWYICSSVYVDELQRSSLQLGQRILAIGLFAVLLAVILGIIFVNRIVQPINQLALTAERVNNGDLRAQSGIERDDEVGMLAHVFDTMVQQLRRNIHSLDQRVRERTLELALMEERQRLILDALPAQIAYLDNNLKYIFVNQGYADLFGGNKASITGQTLASLAPDMLAAIQPEVDRCLAGEEVRFEYRFHFDGRDMITRRLLLPDFNADGEVIGVLNLSLDITNEKEAERRLMEAQRISAAGQLAGGLAHDFNNLLSIIQGNLMAAGERAQQNDVVQRYLAPALRATRRGAELTGRLLTFSRRQELTPHIADLNSLLSDTVELISGSLPKNIRVLYQIDSRLPLYVDAAQLENALVNLALNARDAMPEGGDIVFSVSDRSISRPLAFDEPVVPGDYVEISVRDNGTGFSRDALTQAYEPFFTTKSRGKGSGLGLSMVYGFIKQSQGYISLTNGPQGGAAVTILLPAGTAPVAALPELAIRRSGEEKITFPADTLVLLAEDDDDLRLLLREQLTALGFQVLEAADADEAAELITSVGAINVLVSDIDMPGTRDGYGLAHHLRQHNAGAAVLLISGNPDYHPDTAANIPLLRKPFTQDALAIALQQAIRNQHNGGAAL